MSESRVYERLGSAHSAHSAQAVQHYPQVPPPHVCASVQICEGKLGSWECHPTCLPSAPVDQDPKFNSPPSSGSPKGFSFDPVPREVLAPWKIGGPCPPHNSKTSAPWRFYKTSIQYVTSHAQRHATPRHDTTRHGTTRHDTTPHTAPHHYPPQHTIHAMQCLICRRLMSN